MLLVLALLVTMLPVAIPVSATVANDYPVLELDTQTTVTVTGGSLAYLAFTPEVTDQYEFHSIYGTSIGDDYEDAELVRF